MLQQYTCSVRLNGSTQHVVTGKVVTIPEIAVLRRIHGNDAIADFKPMEPVRRNDSEERERLKTLYDAATPDSSPIVDALFGPMGQLPKTLGGIGIDAKAAAAEMRARAQAALTAADMLDGEPDELDAETADELKAFEDAE
jgi:hypothetical protein